MPSRSPGTPPFASASRPSPFERAREPMPLPPRDFTQIGPNEGEILATLGATPGGIGDLARGLSGAQRAKRPEEGEWCFTEILDHLLAGERDTILPRLRGMPDEAQPGFPSSAASRAAPRARRSVRQDPWTVELRRRILGEALALDGPGAEARERRLAGAHRAERQVSLRHVIHPGLHDLRREAADARRPPFALPHEHQKL